MGFNTVGTGKLDPKTIGFNTVGVESHIWSLGPGSGLGPVSLSHCVESHIWSLGPVSLSQLC